MALVFIDGADGAGKTSVAKKVVELINGQLCEMCDAEWVYHHVLGNDIVKGVFRDFAQAGVLPVGVNDIAEDLGAIEMAMALNANVVFDRTPLSAHIYRLAHNWPGIHPEFQTWIWDWIAEGTVGKALFVEIESTTEAMHKRRDYRWSRIQVSGLVKAFGKGRLAIPSSVPTAYVYNPTNDTEPATGVLDCASKVLDAIEEAGIL